MSQSPLPPPPLRITSQLLEEDADLRDIIEQFVGALPARVAELQTAYEKLDWEQLAALTHRLKGASGSYGYPDLSAVAAAMEQACRSHAAQDFSSWIAQIDAYVKAARAGLDNPA